MNFIRNRNFRAGPQTSLEGFICPQNSDKQQKIKVFGRSGGVLLLDKQKYNWLVPIWLLAFTVDLIAYYYDTQETLARNIFVVIDCMLMYRLMRTAVNKWDMTWLVKISTASFFIYLFHEPWLGYVQGMFFKFVHPHRIFCYLMPWFFCALAVGYSYVAYLILKRFVPKLLNAMTGSR